MLDWLAIDRLLFGQVGASATIVGELTSLDFNAPALARGLHSVLPIDAGKANRSERNSSSARSLFIHEVRNIMLKQVLCLVCASGLSVAMTGCDVEKTSEGRLPNVDVDVSGDAGSLPSYDVDAPDVDVEMVEKTVLVPDVDVDIPEDK